jgi:hypothetical protein
MSGGAHRVGAHLLIQGKEFSPARAELALGLDFGPDKSEPGNLGVRGRFKGTPIPYGSARWEFSWENETGELLPDSLRLFRIPDLSRRLSELGADAITLYVHVGYAGQCNLELSPALLKALADLGVALAISCYELDDDA